MSFESDMKRLEEIAEALRSPNSTLDDSVALFEEGVKLSQKLDKELSKVERKVEILTSSPDSTDTVEMEVFEESLS